LDINNGATNSVFDMSLTVLGIGNTDVNNTPTHSSNGKSTHINSLSYLGALGEIWWNFHNFSPLANQFLNF
jgi:DNA-binding transcriptional regulator LsrR (DeoR family)